MENDENHDYVKSRLGEQITWYSKRAAENKKKFHGYQSLIIIVSALIPIVNVIDFAPVEIRIISSILGGIIIGSTSILQLKKHHENWIMYRSTEEILKKEKYTFENNVGTYTGLSEAEQHKLLVEKVESIISNQNVSFFVVHQTKPNEKPS